MAKSIIEELGLVPVKKKRKGFDFDFLFSLAILGVLIFLFTRKGEK